MIDVYGDSMESKLHQKMFNVAQSVSEVSEFPRIKIGAVVARKHNILAVGVNQLKSHPLQKKYNKNRFTNNEDSCQHHLHAEMDALSKIRFTDELNKAVIYVFRKNNNDKLAMSRPCPGCMARIKDVGIKKVYYTTEFGFAVEHLNKENLDEVKV